MYKKAQKYGYVAIPEGKMLKYDYKTRTTYKISSKMPRDKNTVARGESYIKSYKQTYTTQERKKRWYEQKRKESVLNKILSLFIEGK